MFFDQLSNSERAIFLLCVLIWVLLKWRKVYKPFLNHILDVISSIGISFFVQYLVFKVGVKTFDIGIGIHIVEFSRLWILFFLIIYPIIHYFNEEKIIFNEEIEKVKNDFENEKIIFYKEIERLKKESEQKGEINHTFINQTKILGHGKKEHPFLNLLNISNDIHYKYDFPPKYGFYISDDQNEYLNTIIVNLIGNARKHNLDHAVKPIIDLTHDEKHLILTSINSSSKENTDRFKSIYKGDLETPCMGIKSIKTCVDAFNGELFFKESSIENQFIVKIKLPLILPPIKDEGKT